MDPQRAEWLAQVVEEVIDPHRQIVDPHHHLWPPNQGLPYGVDDLVADTGVGHNVVGTVFIECHAAYRTEGPEHERCLGETEFVANSAQDLAERFPEAAPIQGIVAHADLTLDRETLTGLLDAHAELSGGRFCGIRDALAHAVEPDAMAIAGRYPLEKSTDSAFRAGVATLGERGLVYDSWHYHYQLSDFTALAQAVPQTTMVLDHFATPIGVGSFAGQREEIFAQWKLDMAEAAKCQNVVAKLGGLAMPDNGFGWHSNERPPTSDEFVAAQERYYHHTIEVFGPERCMFESNFPVDQLSLSYNVLWNGLKKIAARYTDAEQDAMFSGTATRTYGLN